MFAHINRQFFQTALADSEKTYSGFTDGCAKAGRAGCKLIEITGDNATGDDVKTLIDNSHDVVDFLLKVVGLANHAFILAYSGDLSQRIQCPSRTWSRKGYGFPIFASLITCC
jgi:hypothetical protein